MAFTKNAAAPLTFGLIDAATGQALTGVVPVGRRCIDGGVQAAVAGVINELGNGQYFLDGQADDFNARENPPQVGSPRRVPGKLRNRWAASCFLDITIDPC